MTEGRLKRNTREGKWIESVRRLGQVPPCVRDAFSWLPHPLSKGKRGRGGRLIWFWMSHHQDQPDAKFAPAIAPPDSERCYSCIFQEPAWSQGYAGCSHSFLRDKDGDCQAFVDRDELLAQHPSYHGVCQPPGIPADADLHALPYWRDGTCCQDFKPSANLPSGYHVRLNMRGWWNDGASTIYGASEHERLRRFWQWAEQITIEREGVYQPHFL